MVSEKKTEQRFGHLTLCEGKRAEKALIDSEMYEIVVSIEIGNYSKNININ